MKQLQDRVAIVTGASKGILAKKMPDTPKSCMGGGLNFNPFGTPTLPALGTLFWTRQAEIGSLNRVQLGFNTT